jgi:D-3-phosphoglycerate dehydrogenase
LKKNKVFAPGLVYVRDKWNEQPDESTLNKLKNRIEEIADLNAFRPKDVIELKEAVRDAEIIIGGVRSTEKLLREAEKLEMIQTIGVGFDHIDIEVCTEKGVIVCNVAEIYTEAVAQHAWGLILDLTKKITRADRDIRAGTWQTQDWMGYQIWGKTIGVIGLGNIGSRVALKGCLAFGMKVLAYDPYINPARAQLFCAELVGLNSLLKEADIVTLCVPLNQETYHLIGEEQLSTMKNTAYIINVCRGPVMDEEALIKSLQKEEIMGAGLDVHEIEPISVNNPLLKMDNVVLTPHIASSTRKAVNETFNGAVSNIIRYIKGEKPCWIVNTESYKKK